MSPYDQGKMYFGFEGFAGFSVEAFTVFTAGLLLVRDTPFDVREREAFAWGFLAAYHENQDHFRKIKEQAEKEQEP